MPAERLQKIIAAAGVASRRKAEELITTGRVSVNGQTVTELGSKADSESDDIRVDGKPLHAEQPVYIVLHKPKGYVTTASDPEGRPTVLDLLKGVPQRVFPVGRLDYLSEGLLLLTNDGDLAAKLTHASTHVPKRYLVKVSGDPAEKDIQRLREGVVLPPEHGHVHAPAEEGGKFAGQKRRSTAVSTAPAKIVLIREGDNPWYEVTLVEGRNRQIRRMFSFIGHHVEKIKRVAYGPLELDTEAGVWRTLTPAEVAKLRTASTGRHETAAPDRKTDQKRISPTKPKGGRYAAEPRRDARPRYESGRTERPREDRKEGRPPFQRGDRPAYQRDGAQARTGRPERPGFQRGGESPRRYGKTSSSDSPARKPFDRSRPQRPFDRDRKPRETGERPSFVRREEGDRGFSKAGPRGSARPAGRPFDRDKAKSRPFDKERKRPERGERPAFTDRAGYRSSGEGRPGRAGGFDRKPGFAGRPSAGKPRDERKGKFSGPRNERGASGGARFGEKRGFGGGRPPYKPKRTDEERPGESPERGRSDDFVNEVARRYGAKPGPRGPRGPRGGRPSKPPGRKRP